MLKYKIGKIKYERSERAKTLARKRSKKWRDKNKEKIRLHNKSLYSSEQKKARRKYSNAIRDGILKKLSYCEICGKEIDIEAHHFNYKKPLKVIYLCNTHHKDIHKYIKIIKLK